MKPSSRVLKEVDPNLNIVSGRRRKASRKDWEKLDGTKCPTCQRDILRVYGPYKQCRRCFSKLKDTYLEEATCIKCSARAVKVTTLAEGLQIVKIICPSCGTYPVIS